MSKTVSDGVHNPIDLADVVGRYAIAMRDGNARRYAYVDNEARRLLRLSQWLTALNTFPGDQLDWPCVLCECEPGVYCFEDRRGFHDGRGFDIYITHPGDRFSSSKLSAADTPAGWCLPTVESGPAHTCRARCLGCGYRGPIVGDENTAAEVSQDHAFPGWRDLPVVPRPPRDGSPKDVAKALERWHALVDPYFPADWFNLGGPIRTQHERDKYGRLLGGRHVPSYAPGGGYDMATEDVCEFDFRSGRTPLAPRRVETVAVGDQFALDFGI